MGRPRSFDEADVLQRAMDCFWTRGYEASSLDDLCGAMGISRSSFYQCFGNKHDLLLATLDRYGDETMARMQATFAAGRSFRDSLAAFLEAAVADAAPTGERGAQTLRDELVQRGQRTEPLGLQLALEEEAAHARVLVDLLRQMFALRRAPLSGAN